MDVSYQATSKVLENEDTLYPFLTYNFKRSILQLQERLAEAEAELSDLNEALSTPPTHEELNRVQGKINEVVTIRKILSNRGFEDPYAQFNSVINNFSITIRFSP